MAPLIAGLGYDWALEQTAKCIKELVTLVRPNVDVDAADLFSRDGSEEYTSPPITITSKPGDSLDHIEDRIRRLSRHRPTLLRQRHVCRALGFLLRMAQTHSRPRFPRAIPPPANRQGQRSPSPIQPNFKDRKGPRRSQEETTRNAWHRFLPSAAGHSNRVVS